MLVLYTDIYVCRSQNDAGVFAALTFFMLAFYGLFLTPERDNVEVLLIVSRGLNGKETVGVGFNFSVTNVFVGLTFASFMLTFRPALKQLFDSTCES